MGRVSGRLDLAALSGTVIRVNGALGALPTDAFAVGFGPEDPDNVAFTVRPGVGALVDGVVLSAGPMTIGGAGSPEGVRAAPVGSLYLRSDGGAGTSLYVKQAGAGNVGWVAK